jgi:hypothetical protein
MPMQTEIEKLEADLNDFLPEVRAETLGELVKLGQSGATGAKRRRGF